MPRTPLRMPKLSMTMEEGEFSAWLVGVGEDVEAGQPICEVATDKVDMEVESTATGTVAELLAEPGDTLPVGAPLAWIDTDDDSLLDDLLDGSGQPEPAPATTPAPAPAPAPAATPAPPPPPSPAPAIPEATPAPSGAVDALPGARRLARENGVDLQSVAGTGPSGVIRVSDVRHALGDAPATTTTTSVASSASVAPAEPVGGPPPRTQDGIQVTVTLSVTVATPSETAQAAQMLERIAQGLGSMFQA